MQGIPAENFIQHWVYIPVAEFNERIQFAGVSGLLQQEFPEFLFPLFFTEPEPAVQLIEHEVDVHKIKMIRDELRRHNVTGLTEVGVPGSAIGSVRRSQKQQARW
jgi:hypothetical protein